MEVDGIVIERNIAAASSVESSPILREPTPN